MTRQAQPQVSAADRVYNYVRDAIVTASVADNTMLTEGEIAEAVGVSRTPVREALLRLEADDLLQLVPKRGALVRPITMREWQDLVEIRKLFEDNSLKSVIEGGHGAVIAGRLRPHIEDLMDAVSRSDVLGCVDADRAFHAEIIGAAGNQTLHRMYTSLRSRQIRITATNLRSHEGELDPRWAKSTIAEHTAVADAIADGNLRLARSQMRRHIDGAARHQTLVVN